MVRKKLPALSPPRTHGLLRHQEHGQIVVVVVRGDRDRTCALGQDAFRVLLRPPALQLGAADLQDETALEESYLRL